MRKLLDITTFLCALAIPWAGCAAPCPLAPEKGCDWHDPNNECRYVCEDGEQADDHGDEDGAKEPDAPSNEGDQPGGLPSDEDVDAGDE
ncbi:hypothetical protein WME90_45655 [Sorangium sp. So ce375]|uniref:hypothetical protein n=1 Tax=Sorangium sp. So ce375 TaxID=3133306 RepID=UPI003F5AE7C1